MVQNNILMEENAGLCFFKKKIKTAVDNAFLLALLLKMLIIACLGLEILIEMSEYHKTAAVSLSVSV